MGATRAGASEFKNMPLVLAAGKFGARCMVKECRAADLAGKQLPLQQRETHTL
jgi:hypothetical protein